MKKILLIILLNGCLGQNFSNKRFPKDFMFGVATSAYQIEGAWNINGKTESIWDYTLHKYPNITIDHSNGDVACDSYNKIDTDVDLIKKLGVHHYRFSIPWTRILGSQNKINIDGITYYQNLIKRLKQNGIEVMVTLYHWDLPQNIANLGGFLNESFPEWFADYAKVCFQYFGNDVKYWITFNEPTHICHGGYGYGYFPPHMQSEALLIYRCTYNILMAHAKTWHLYDKEFKPLQRGQMSISLDVNAYIPGSESKADVEAADRAKDFLFGMYANPIYVGDFPETVKKRVAQRSLAEGRNQSRLPELTKGEITYIKGTSDFFALNTYTAYLVTNVEKEPPITDPPSILGDQAVNAFQPTNWENSSFSYIKVVPSTARYLFNWVKQRYNNPKIFVTENGYPTHGNEKDDRRVYYIKSYLNEIKRSMDENNIQFLGYTVWSLLDNFQWIFGYTEKFGLYEVDFNDVNRTRTPRPSAGVYRKIIETRCLVDDCVN